MADRALLISSSLSVFQFVSVAHFRSAARKHQRLALADCTLHRATQPPTFYLLSVFFFVSTCRTITRPPRRTRHLHCAIELESSPHLLESLTVCLNI
uniref:Uncharacterized protein n=1 Tax=Zea mays TaxID=4577 RepID=B6T5J8_MAIZE|nr:hypothetical protein [Zea mays]ACG47706.1 hypothetical protein [Zea mays]